MNLDNEKRDPSLSAYLCGDVAYNIEDGSDKDTSTIDAEIVTSTDFSANDISLRSSPWKRLEYSREEITKVEAILKENDYSTLTHTDTSATEMAFRTISDKNSSFDIIHIASHGFFFPNNEGTKQKSKSVFSSAKNPLLRSGLILAGGNKKWMGEQNGNSANDGILTAFEIAGINLKETELVVLSACETGLGEIRGDEGVFGLQRAFKIADVDKILMSLWKVPDQQTQELMELFYDNYLNKKLNISDALSNAQGVMRKKYKQPYFWAGFILLE